MAEDPRAWLSEVAVEENWGSTMLPNLLAKLDEWHIEIEERDVRICIGDGHFCEPVNQGELAKLEAIQRLLDGERKRRNQPKGETAAAQATEHLREQMRKPIPPHPHDH
jgi:hypothetical protein